MSDFKSRLEKLEREYRFRHWFHFERYMESFNEEQLSFFARHGFCKDPQPEPLPPGSSKLDKLDRKRLIELWEDDERRHARFAARSAEDREFFCIHGHWPEHPCDTECVEAEERKSEAQVHFGGTDGFPKKL